MKVRSSKAYKNRLINITFKERGKNSENTDKLMDSLIRNYPIAKGLYLMLKKILNQNNLDTRTNEKGLTSISILLIIISYLQQVNFMRS